MKIKILSIKKKDIAKYNCYSKKLIKNHIKISFFELREFLKQFKNFSIKKHIFLLAKVDNICAGILICNYEIRSGIATIIWLIVDKKFQKKKIGTKLIFAMSNSLKKKSSIHKIRVFSFNKSSNKFYKKLNFSEEGYHPKHWFKKNYWCFGKLIR